MTVDDHQFECGIRSGQDGCLVSLSSLKALPVYHRETIPADYQDLMGHMNIRWYFDLFARTGRKFFKYHGLDEDYFRDGQFGVFALKHFIQYYAEVHVGQLVAIHARLIARSDRRFHFMLFMINETTSQLASAFEALITHADLKIRRAAPMPAEITQKLDATLAELSTLDWYPPVSGAISL
jgi:acyl-CoA thioester hydrolase